MSKVESIKALARLGLNTPKLLLEMHGIKEKDKWLEYYHTHDGRVSIRTEKSVEFKCPHHPNIKLSKASVEIPYLLSQGFSVYVFEPINPEDCLCRGNLFVGRSPNRSRAEYLQGPGTVRDLERASVSNIWTAEFRSLQDIKDQEIHTVVSKLIPLSQYADQIVEWSYYSKPVGNKKDYVIFWEKRPWQ